MAEDKTVSPSREAAEQDDELSAELTTRWPDPAGRPDVVWIERNKRFVEVELEKKSWPIDKLDGEQLGAVLPAEPCQDANCSKRFPSGFSCCPECGTALTSPYAYGGTLWSFPGAEGDGLLNTERVEINRVSAPFNDLYKAPEAPNLTFVVAGTPPRLLAIDRIDSRVFAFDRQKKDWYLYIADTHFDADLPIWSWGILALDKGFAMPTARGAAIVSLNAIGSVLVIDTPSFDSGTCLAGPVALGGDILFLCGIGGKLVIVTYSVVSGTWEPATTLASEAWTSEWFAAPVAKGSNVYWLGEGGYIAVRGLQGGRFETNWRKWPAGFVPELRIRPIWAEMALWQFGNKDGQAQFARVAFRGEQIVHDVENTHLTAGECSYTAGMRVFSTPWDEEQVQQVGAGDSFFLPICGLKGVSAIVADCGFDPNNRRYSPAEVLVDGVAKKPARLCIHRRGSPPIDLGRSPGISSISQLQAIVFERHLLIYDAGSNRIDAWTIHSDDN